MARNNRRNADRLKGYFDSQKKVFKTYLSKNIATCSMVADQTGIPQKNLTRYKDQLENQGLLKVVFVARCRKTGFKAQYLTTNPDLIESMKGGIE